MFGNLAPNPARLSFEPFPLPPDQHTPTSFILLHMPHPQPSTPNNQPPPPPNMHTNIETPPPPVKPSTQWETLYIYAFLVKFMRPKVIGIDVPSDFEDALEHEGFIQPLFDVLSRLLIKLESTLEGSLTRDNISEHLIEVVEEFCEKIKERSIWWDETTKANVHPFNEEIDFFSLHWNVKLMTLRQLVDWILTYSPVKDCIDLSWEVKYQRKKKKTNKTLAAEFAPPSADDPMSAESLAFIPLGQDSKRIRYWAVDDSPRLYVSSNPWRAQCPLYAVTSTREEYMDVVQSVRDAIPPLAAGAKRPKFDLAHEELSKRLEERIPAIDRYAEDLRIEKIQRLEAEKERLKAEAAAAEAKAKEARRAAGTKAKTRNRAFKKPDRAAGDATPADTIESQDEEQSVTSQSTTQVHPSARSKSKQKLSNKVAKPRASTNSMPNTATATAPKVTGKRKRRATLPAKKPEEDEEEFDQLADDSDEDIDSEVPPLLKPLPPPPASPEPEPQLAGPSDSSAQPESPEESPEAPAPVPSNRRRSTRLSAAQGTNAAPPQSKKAAKPAIQASSSRAPPNVPTRKRSRLGQKTPETDTLAQDTEALVLASPKPPKRLKLEDDEQEPKLVENSRIKTPKVPSGRRQSSRLNGDQMDLDDDREPETTAAPPAATSLTRTPKLTNGGWTVLPVDETPPTSTGARLLDKGQTAPPLKSRIAAV